MALYDSYAPVDSDYYDDDEKSKLAFGGYPPVAPAAAASAPPVKLSPDYPPVGSTDDLEARVARPQRAIQETAMPPVESQPPQTPAVKRLSAMTAQGAPPVEPLHGWKRALDAVAQLTWPTQQISNSVRYGPQRAYERNLGAAEQDVAGETAAETAPAARKQIEDQPAHTEAETEELGKRGEKEEAEADALQHPKEKPTNAEEATVHDLMTGENGQPRINPQTNKPYTYLEAFGAVKQAAQDTKPENDQTDKTVRIVNGVPHEILIDKKTGHDIRDLGQTKLPGESPDAKRSAAEQVQVEREARAAVHKAEQDYNSARSTVAMQRQLIKDAKAGNKEAVRIVPLEGALQITTSQGVHRINRTEVDQYGQAGSLFDRIMGRIGSGVSGKSIPDDVLQDMDAMTQELERNAHQRYKREYDYNKQVVEGYGGKDFDKRVPMVPEEKAGTGEGGEGSKEPPRPPNVPANYIHKADGPKGSGWYKP